MNALAKFVSGNEVEYTLQGELQKVTAPHFVIAVGGRPSLPEDVPGVAEYVKDVVT